ncbi:hypothetical protein SARC_08913 [Sphaeroforma arctica JP610]|uniref:RRM domain-containing protein n=1 Tax=Sphaeroforma arctica JP610 TaxID=667725 RepID=A0A0L0FPC6_9EUKA|nr:hypothetical protein SARC_08913 [Sphaeroforma arctica JP610]KNC78665.1 hypothetical protein SARC_08913 [Sphaeroforma arctica JP610]|eukprot:XP_014152567.1 hypothetical protein SARC_08913 [Sphaeroforma arctica JP610]
MAEAPATSRLIVKNLPKYATDKLVRDHFTQKGEVTDVKLMYTGYVRIVQVLCCSHIFKQSDLEKPNIERFSITSRDA